MAAIPPDEKVRREKVAIGLRLALEDRGLTQKAIADSGEFGIKIVQYYFKYGHAQDETVRNHVLKSLGVANEDTLIAKAEGVAVAAKGRPASIPEAARKKIAVGVRGILAGRNEKISEAIKKSGISDKMWKKICDREGEKTYSFDALSQVLSYLGVSDTQQWVEELTTVRRITPISPQTSQHSIL